MDLPFSSPWFWVVAVLVAFGLFQLYRRHVGRGNDIHWPALPAALPWGDPSTADEAIGKVYDYAVGFGNSSIGWYQSRRRPKRLAGFALRAGALVATVSAGLVPLADNLEIPEIKPVWSTLLLALAGLCVSIDHLGGFTSGWVRYMLAQQKIERLRDTFLLEWNALRAGPANVQVMLERAKVFLLSVGKVVDDETLEWATEFQNALKELERARRTESEAQRTGGVQITVKNPQIVNGWTLEIDGSERGRSTGRTLAATDVMAGIRKVRIHGENAQRQRFSDEKIVRVDGGSVVERELELS
jgi:hypothetical protein